MCIRDRPSLALILSSQRGLVARDRLWITAQRLWNDTRLHAFSSCPVSAALWLELVSGSQHGGFGTTPFFTRPPFVQWAQPCGSSSALDHSTEALERHPPSLVLRLSSQRGIVARARLWITAWTLWNDIRLHSRSSCPLSGALWLEIGSGSQNGGFGMTPCLLYTSPSPRDLSTSRMPSSA